MKKARHRRSRPVLQGTDDLREEYEVDYYDYSKARTNRFAGKLTGDCVAIVLEPDVAAVFRDAEAVNRLLRSVIAALSTNTRRTRHSSSLARR